MEALSAEEEEKGSIRHAEEEPRSNLKDLQEEPDPLRGNPSENAVGKNTHQLGNNCSAKSATSYKCNRKGQFSSHSNKSVAMTSENADLDTVFLGALSSNCTQEYG